MENKEEYNNIIDDLKCKKKNLKLKKIIFFPAPSDADEVNPELYSDYTKITFDNNFKKRVINNFLETNMNIYKQQNRHSIFQILGSGIFFI